MLIYGNRFTGSIPTVIGELNLFALQAQDNELSGSIPTEFWRNTNLIVLRLDNNMLTGQLDGLIGELSSLADLRISDNRFTGTLPPLLWGLTDLRKFTDLSIQPIHGNRLTNMCRELAGCQQRLHGTTER